MHCSRRITALAAPLAVLCAALPVRAGTLPPSSVIDDFSTGLFYRATPALTTTTFYTATGVWGGSRAITTYGNTGPDPSYGQTSSVSNGQSPARTLVPTGLVLGAGYQVFPRVEVAYGAKKAFNYNLTGYDRLRVTLGNLEYSLNFNAQFRDKATVLTDWGCNLPATSLGVDLALDMPFSDYPGFDFKNITAVFLILQASTNWSVKKVEVIAASVPMGDVVCHAVASAPPVATRQ